MRSREERETRAVASNLFWHSVWPWVFAVVSWAFGALIVWSL